MSQKDPDYTVPKPLKSGRVLLSGMVLTSGTWRSGSHYKSGSWPIHKDGLLEVPQGVWDEAAAQGFLLAPRIYQIRLASGEGRSAPTSSAADEPAPLNGSSIELVFRESSSPAAGRLRQSWISRNVGGYVWQLVVESADDAPRATLTAAALDAADSRELTWSSVGSWEFFGANRVVPVTGMAPVWNVELLVTAL